MKRLLFCLALVVAFFIGYGTTAKAIGVPGMREHYGYFHNKKDTAGDFVWKGGIPTSINSASEFISYVKGKLGGGTQNRVGASFIIQTMIGTSRGLPPSSAQISEWEKRVRNAEDQGLVVWNRVYSYGINSFYQDGPKDDAFYSESGSQSAILFYNSSKSRVLYAIKHNCANPVGNVDPLERAPEYTITGRTTVSAATAIPGASVTFRHYVRNQGPDTANNINWEARVSPGDAKKDSGKNNFTRNQERNVSNETYRIPIDAAFDSQICRYVYFKPAKNGAGTGRGTNACVRVIADFQLTPIVTANKSTAVQGETVVFNYGVANSGPTRSRMATCRVIGNVRPTTYTPLPQQDVARTSDAGFSAPSTNCPRELPVTGAASTPVGTENYVVGNITPGQRVCRSLVVDPRNEQRGPRTSREVCVMIAKEPYVHIMGNDIWAGGGFKDRNCNTYMSAKIQTVGRTLASGATAGSASEYGAFALGAILNFGSANKALINASGPAGKALSFANTPGNGNYGAPQHCINDYYDKFSSEAQALAEGGGVNVGARGSGVWRVTTSDGTVNFSGATMPAGAQQVYLVDSDAVINGDIKYPSSYNGVGDIPSLIIITRGGMTVTRATNQIDGLMVIRGTLRTCDLGGGEIPHVNLCNTQLVFNGAVIANHIDFFRTFGAQGSTDAQRQQAGEVFRFSPELYLRNPILNGSAVMKTMDQKDLPPRF